MEHVEIKRLFSSLAATALLAGCASVSPQNASAMADAQAAGLLNQAAVIHGHLDLWNRQNAIERYKRGDKTHAIFLFKQAALYGDKPSQAMVATMYWNGDGVKKDRPLAYAWMDLAADRGYPKLLAQRESYWKKLSSSERQVALDLGKTVYAKYGDAKASQRLAWNLAQIRQSVTGSHLGAVSGQLQVTVVAPASIQAPSVKGGAYRGMQSRGSTTYAPKLTASVSYMNLKDQAWQASMNREGNVDVGALQQLRTAPATHDSSDGNDKPNP